MTFLTTIGIFIGGLFLRLLLVLGVVMLLSLPFILLAAVMKGAENFVHRHTKAARKAAHDHA